MKFIVESESLFDILTNSDDKERFSKRFFRGLKSFSSMPLIEIDIYDAMTRGQKGLIWRDWGIVAKLLYTNSMAIYSFLVGHHDLADCWKSEAFIGKSRIPTEIFISLSSFTKEHLKNTDFINRYREICQDLVNREYGEYVYIEWSSKENKARGD